MGTHIVDGEFQSDKYPTCPRGKVPLAVKDPTAQDLLWEYAQRRRSVDSEFSSDLEAALREVGYITNEEAAALRKSFFEGLKDVECTIAELGILAGLGYVTLYETGWYANEDGRAAWEKRNAAMAHG